MFTKGSGTESNGAKKVLEDLILRSRVNQCWDYNAIDSPEHCLDIHKFYEYPSKIEYQYNSRGFRDTEWPTDIDQLKHAVWCVGDSFTVGLGSAFERTWVQMLQSATGKRCINISLEGASNAWISRKAQSILKQVQPTNLVVLWTYYHRRELADDTLTDEQRRVPANPQDEEPQDIDYFDNCTKFLLDSHSTNIVSAIIPNDFSATPGSAAEIWQSLRDPSWPECPATVADFNCLPSRILKELKDRNAYQFLQQRVRFAEICARLDPFIGTLPLLDRSRDGYHFDQQTSAWFVHRLLPLLR